MRAGPMLLRSAGPCIRCKAVECNYDKKIFNAEEEPNSTLYSYRNMAKKGVVFGMYYQMDLLINAEIYDKAMASPTSESYQQACKKHNLSEDRYKNRYI